MEGGFRSRGNFHCEMSARAPLIWHCLNKGIIGAAPQYTVGPSPRVVLFLSGIYMNIYTEENTRCFAAAVNENNSTKFMSENNV